MADVRRQITGDRDQKSDDRGQWSGDRGRGQITTNKKNRRPEDGEFGDRKGDVLNFVA